MAENNILKNTNRAITNSIRNTSCSTGWLKQLNQILFGTITVLAFALLMLMVLREAIANNREPECEGCYPCTFSHCSVVCANTDLLGISSELAHIFKETNENCQGRGIILKLSNAIFEYNELPHYWLTEHDLNISSLEIVGGNLRDIPATAFNSRSFTKLQSLTFQAITITKLTTETFQGLSVLAELNIRSSMLVEVQENALQPMESTLRTLQITGSSGVNPINFTGSLYLDNLTVVDMSFNDLFKKLNQRSFRGLQSCRLLYLTSSRIKAIGMGAFDYLENIERIDLSDNLLKALPGRIFDRIIPPSIDFHLKIDLHENPWRCNCRLERMIMLYKKNILMVDPLCHSPAKYHNQPFSSIDSLCNDTVENTTQNTPATLVKPSQLTDLITELSTELIGTVTLADEEIKSIRTDLTTVPTDSIKILNSSYHNTLCEEEETLKYLDLKCGRNTSAVTLEFLFYQRNATNTVTAAGSIWKSLQGRFEMNNNFESFELIWFQTLCPQDIYCISEDSFEIYGNMHDYQKVYCAVEKSSRIIKAENCISFVAVFLDHDKAAKAIMWVIFPISVLTCAMLSALLVFVTVRKHPKLLKGSKRVLFVQNRVVHALVLPPGCTKANLARRDSGRSSISGTPSYISALQPTEDQLANWRINRLAYLDPNMTITSISRSEKLPYGNDNDGFQSDMVHIYESMGSNI